MTYKYSDYQAEQEAKQIARNKPIKAYANHAMYSDVQPFEVIEVRTENKVIIRSMNAERKANWKPEIVAGGFSGICLNNDDQDDAWDITPDEDGYTVAIRWSKAKRQWFDADGCRYFMSDEPVKFYDYNF